MKNLFILALSILMLSGCMASSGYTYYPQGYYYSETVYRPGTVYVYPHHYYGRPIYHGPCGGYHGGGHGRR